MWLALAMALLIHVPMATTGGTISPDGTLESYATNSVNGGISPPRGTSSCSGWQRGVDTYQATNPDAVLTMVRPDGVTVTIYFRACQGTIQYAWVPELSPQQLAQSAYDEATAQIPKPVLLMAPPADKQIVNLEAWFGVERTADVSATASIPGLAATVTATPTGITLKTGSSAPGEKTVIKCALWGSATRPTNGCTWKPKFPSIPKFTGGGYAFKGSITVTWSVTWTSTSGDGGDLGTYDSTTPVDIAVREIQTIGGDR